MTSPQGRNPGHCARGQRGRPSLWATFVLSGLLLSGFAASACGGRPSGVASLRSATTTNEAPATLVSAAAELHYHDGLAMCCQRMEPVCVAVLDAGGPVVVDTDEVENVPSTCSNGKEA